MLSTYLYMGNFDQVIEESQQFDIDISEQTGSQMKSLIIVRALTCKQDFPQLKSMMQEMIQDQNQSHLVPNLSILIQYLAQKVSLF